MSVQMFGVVDDAVEEGYQAGQEAAEDQAEEGEYIGGFPVGAIDSDGGIFGTPAPSETATDYADSDGSSGGSPYDGADPVQSGPDPEGMDTETVLLAAVLAAIALFGVMKWADS